MFATNNTYQRISWILIFLVTAFIPSRNGQTIQTSVDHPLYMSAHPSASSAGNFSIFGKDDRFEITNTPRFPYSAVTLIRIYWTADDLVGNACTGWMIGPSTLATAAHCIYDKGYAHHVIIKPAMNSDAHDQTPYGTCPVIDGVVPDQWIQNHSIEYDYGVYHLDCTVGDKTGTLGFKMISGDWAQKDVQLTGYPSDKQGRTMWSGYGKVTSSTAKGLYYDNDMAPGQSGSPVWDYADDDCAYCVVAINSSQFTAPARNYGVRINKEVFQFLSSQVDYRPNR